MKVIKLSEDLLIPQQQLSTLFVAEDTLEESITLLLPKALTCVKFEFLQLSNYDIVLQINSHDSTFLLPEHPKKIILLGNQTNYGRSLIVEGYNNYWRLLNQPFEIGS